MTLYKFVLIICIVFLHSQLWHFTKGNKDSKTFIEECLEDILKEWKNNNKFTCKTSKTSYILWLKKFKSDKHALYCLTIQLQGDKLSKEQKDQHWGHLIQLVKSKSCLKKLSKLLTNKTTKLFSKWSFLGPFQIGKQELDGQPFLTEEAVNNRWSKKFIAYSELLQNGIVKWDTLDAVNTDTIQLNPNVNWNDLVMSMQSMAMTEWQGVLINDFVVFNKNTDVLIKCLGTSFIFIDDILLNADVYHQNIFW